MNKTLASTFDRVLRYAYGVDSRSTPDTESKPKDDTLFNSITNIQSKQVADKKPKPKIMGALLPAASHLVDSFLSTSSGTLRFQPLLETLDDGFHHPPSTTFINVSTLSIDLVTATLSFSATLLRVGTLLDRPHSQLESQLFKISPLISRLYAVNDAYQLPVVALFEALIISASKDVGEPPSLLGYLGTETSKNFLHVLSDLDKPLCREECVTAIWHFLATVVSNRQQWFANYLLTGKSSKNALKDKGCGKDLAAFDRPILGEFPCPLIVDLISTIMRTISCVESLR
jgi:nuclear pore complex protein Nup188